MKSNISTSCNLLGKSINQVIYFLTNCFTFLIKFWMLPVKKSRICGISVIFLQCCFMSVTQVLMAVSRNHFLEGDRTFQYETSFLSGEGCPKRGLFLGGGGDESKIISWDGGMTLPCPLHFPTMGNPEFKYYLVSPLVLFTLGMWLS